VCGDPDNLPFSNSKSEGFENKIAEGSRPTWAKARDYWWRISAA
jgi:hypothetical protein